MFKKTMKFDNLHGDEVTQTFYFNYNKKEIAELLEFKRLEEKLALLTTPVEESGLSQQENNQQAYDIFQDLILDAYGVKGEDNVTFDKTPELRHYWSTHVAFVELIFEFLENPSLAAEFIENCLPAKMVAKAKVELAAENKGNLSPGSLSEMVQEANLRQQDPATRIEPGVIPEDSDPEIVAIAKHVADGGMPMKKVQDLTEADILEMDDISFAKINPQELSKDQMVVAFRRKLKS